MRPKSLASQAFGAEAQSGKIRDSEEAFAADLETEPPSGVSCLEGEDATQKTASSSDADSTMGCRERPSSGDSAKTIEKFEKALRSTKETSALRRALEASEPSMETVMAFCKPLSLEAALDPFLR